MHQMRTGIFIAASVLLLLGLPPQAPGQESKQEHPIADSSAKKTHGMSVDSAAAAKKDSVHADSLHVIPDTLGRMSTPSLVGTLDRTLDTAQYVTQDDIHWIDFEYIGSILETFPGVYIRDQARAARSTS
jgi:hypothetical protein